MVITHTRSFAFWALAPFVISTANPALAQIYNDQTNQVIPGTEGITPAPGIDLSNWNSTGHQLQYAKLSYVDLTNALFTNSDLTNATFQQSTLTSADFTGAIIQGANFWNVNPVGLTSGQLYSTASYANGDLSGIGLNGNLSGWDFENQNLTGASFSLGITQSNLSGADFTNANLSNANFSDTDIDGANLLNAIISNAYFSRNGTLSLEQIYTTASYKNKDLHGINCNYLNFSNANFAGQDLTGASFAGGGSLSSSNLTNANLTAANFQDCYLAGTNFTGAIVFGASFGSSEGINEGFGLTQLATTASFQAKDLHGIGLFGLDLTGGAFAGFNLAQADLDNTNLSSVSLGDANLTGVELQNATLTGADLSNSNLTNATLSRTILTNTNFANSIVVGARFFQATGFTLPQLYSTASYQALDLHGIGLEYLDLTGINLSSQNLAGADFTSATLTGANFSNAIVTGANFTGASGFTFAQLYSTASYQTKTLGAIGLSELDITGLNLAGQDLTNANFGGATLTDTNLTGAVITGANFNQAAGFTLPQLYSTASYQVKKLQGVGLEFLNLTGANLAGQNLTNADFGAEFDPPPGGAPFANLTNVNLTDATLINAFLIGVTLTNTNLTNADLRGADISSLTGAIVTNTILPNGNITGLHLTAGGPALTIHNYDTPQAVPGTIAIDVSTQMILDPGSTLQMIFDGSAWNSTISFDPGIPVTIVGSDLDLEVDSSTNPTSLLGVPLQLFNWTGVSPMGQFTITTDLPAIEFQWDTSKLYSEGIVTLDSVPEPTGIPLMVAGTAALLIRRRQLLPIM